MDPCREAAPVVTPARDRGKTSVLHHHLLPTYKRSITKAPIAQPESRNMYFPSTRYAPFMKIQS
jgi:hypothetical protein